MVLSCDKLLINFLHTPFIILGNSAVSLYKHLIFRPKLKIKIFQSFSSLQIGVYFIQLLK